MAGMSKTCNHVEAGLFRVEAASRLGLNNPSCTSKACEWLPSNKAVKPVQTKELKLCRDGFGTRGKKEEPSLMCHQRQDLTHWPTVQLNPLANSTTELALEDIACALKEVCEESDCLVYSTIPKKIISKDTVKPVLPNPTLLEDILFQATSDIQFLQLVENITK